MSELVFPINIREFSRELVNKSKSFGSNVGTSLLISTTSGSPSLDVLAISFNRLNLPELSR